MLEFNLSTTISLFIIFLTIYFYWIRDKNIPPGPFALPFFGNIFSLRKCPVYALAAWGKKYGPVYRIYLGRKLAIVLNDVSVIKEALSVQGYNFSGRPNPLPFVTKMLNSDSVAGMQKKNIDEDAKMATYHSGAKGLLMSEGELWQKQRSFALSTLKDFGMGKNILEKKINEEIQCAMEEMTKNVEKPFNMRDLISLAVSNVICSIVYGKRFAYNDTNFLGLLRNIHLLSQSTGSANILNSFPMSRFFIKRAKIMFENIIRTKYETNNFHNSLIDEHVRNFNPDEINDYIDAFLKQMEKEKSEKTTFTRKQLERSINTLLMAGTETVVSTMQWGILFLMLNVDVQKKVQEEIDKVIGSSRSPTMIDYNLMPYTKATIMEIQRLGNVVPLSIPHSNFKETTLLGFRIPRRTLVLCNLWLIHTDDRLWNQPMKFDPSRFLDVHDNVVKSEYFIPFSLGKRVCLGESLAKMELFLFFASFLQKFSVHLPKDKPLPSLEPIVGLTLGPKPYEVYLTLH